MKKALALFFTALFLLAAAEGASAEDRKNIISTEKLHTLVDDSYFLNIIDLRPQEDYDAGHIPQAVNFPLRELKSSIQSLIEDGFSVLTSQLIVYGETEQEGIDGAEILVAFGFTNVWRLENLELWGGDLISTEDEMRPFKNLNTVDLKGNRVNAGILTGHRLTIINVWATYLPMCADEIAALGRLARELEPQGVQIVGVLSDALGATFEPDPEILATAREMLETADADYINLVPSKEVYIDIIGQITAIPTTFFVDETGTLVGRSYPGAYSYEDWSSFIQEMLHEMK